MALHQARKVLTVNTHTHTDTSTRVTKPDNQFDHALIVWVAVDALNLLSSLSWCMVDRYINIE